MLVPKTRQAKVAAQQHQQQHQYLSLRHAMMRAMHAEQPQAVAGDDRLARRPARRRRPRCLCPRRIGSVRQQAAATGPASATGTQQQQPAASAALTSLRAAARQVAAPRVLVAAAAGFCLVAASVVGPGAPTSPLLQLDGSLHALVAGHLDPVWRGQVADVLISDAAISAGLAGWAACSACSLAAAPRPAAPQLALAWGVYLTTCGAVGRGDPPLVAGLKAAFARARPSDLHHSFSFPSGHTSAAVFTAGGLLLVLLPLTLRLLGRDTAAPQRPGSGSTEEQQQAAAPEWVYAAWAVAGASTAAGRVLADAHWLSDTLAGGCLGVAVASALALASQRLEEAVGEAGRCSSGASSSSGGGGEASEQH